jgi:predicted DNA-binding protein
MTAGGKRKGAGRKPRSKPRETISVKIEPEHAERFRAICKDSGKSQSQQFTEWINHGITSKTRN